ncbi:hypothetical protein F511_25774 [Dorcoceras hygrometricum]|uniref:Uncharacterized protein n=1 Tax=Dorcoceras hygrometricum TaxID=472368 RepID=A0A2Z7C455_9LAMI|nr:hypothetical protein F511_25774 [Dorcoceras hygrometricum]
MLLPVPLSKTLEELEEDCKTSPLCSLLAFVVARWISVKIISCASFRASCCASKGDRSVWLGPRRGKCSTEDLRYGCELVLQR